MSPATRALQDDDAQNPVMLWVRLGETLWQRSEGAFGRSCVDGHEDAARSMRRAATQHPRFDATIGLPVDLATRIRHCRTRHQQTAPLEFDVEPFAPGALELVEIELFLVSRVAGVALETPAIRPRADESRR